MIGLLKRQTERKIPAKTAAESSTRPRANDSPHAVPVPFSPLGAINAAGDVRLSLAGRLVTLLPDMCEEKHAQLYAYTVQTLGTLALEEILKIRQALTSTLKDLACAPPKIASDLARDIERDVSEPILRFYTGLSDKNLLNILHINPVTPMLASASFKNLPSLKTADVTESRLQNIIQKSKSCKEWKAPASKRTPLPTTVAKDIAEFIDASVRDLLMNRGHFDSRTTEEITAVFRRRLNRMGEKSKTEFNDDSITDALALRDYDFIFSGLARGVRAEKSTITEIFETRSAKSIVALCWKAGLSMRTALALQRELGLVSPARLIYPKGGTDYPFTPDELRWQLEFLGLSKA